MAVPSSVSAALRDVRVEGAVCLDAGAGVGNSTAGLLAAGAERVYAVTEDPAHARAVRERVTGAASAGRDHAGTGRTARDERDRLGVLRADLRETPLRSDSIDLVVAHALFNVVPPESVDAIAAELTRVAGPAARLVVDDYAPVPSTAPIAELFALENAAATLATGRPALSFYPASVLAGAFERRGWTVTAERELLDPVPWTDAHRRAHADAVRDYAADLPDELGEPLTDRADALVANLDGEDCGAMYSVAFRRGA